MSEVKMTPKEYLKKLGWRQADYPNAMDDPNNEYRVFCWEEDSEEDWALSHFTDGDINGVATGRFEPTDKEGDTLGELKNALADLNLIDPVKFRAWELMEVLNQRDDPHFLAPDAYLVEDIRIALMCYLIFPGKPPL